MPYAPLVRRAEVSKAAQRKSSTQSNERVERVQSSVEPVMVQACIFCETISPAHNLRQVMTSDLNDSLNECTKIL